MKKLSIVVALLATAGIAMGAGFSLPGVTETLADQTIQIPISAVGSVNIAGVNLNMESDPALLFTDISFDNGIFAGKATPPNITIMPPYLIASTTTTSGTVATPGVVAVVSINVPAGTPNGDYFIRTYVPAFEMVSDFADAAIAPDSQGSGMIRVIPEPATALLLIGAVPFLRRRKA